VGPKISRDTARVREREIYISLLAGMPQLLLDFVSSVVFGKVKQKKEGMSYIELGDLMNVFEVSKLYCSTMLQDYKIPQRHRDVAQQEGLCRLSVTGSLQSLLLKVVG
jgi:hypothetical protein